MFFKNRYLHIKSWSSKNLFCKKLKNDKVLAKICLKVPLSGLNFGISGLTFGTFYFIWKFWPAAAKCMMKKFILDFLALEESRATRTIEFPSTITLNRIPRNVSCSAYRRIIDKLEGFSSLCQKKTITLYTKIFTFIWTRWCHSVHLRNMCTRELYNVHLLTDSTVYTSVHCTVQCTVLLTLYHSPSANVVLLAVQLDMLVNSVKLPWIVSGLLGVYVHSLVCITGLNRINVELRQWQSVSCIWILFSQLYTNTRHRVKNKQIKAI